VQQPVCTLEDLLKEVVAIKINRDKRRSATQTKLEHALTAINQHAQVIDVLIQQQPDITALVWGAIRFLIGVCFKWRKYHIELAPEDKCRG
jgi:hypothetical protein